MAKKRHEEWIARAERGILKSTVHRGITNRTQDHEQIRNGTHGLKQHLQMNEAGYLELGLSPQWTQFLFFFFHFILLSGSRHRVHRLRSNLTPPNETQDDGGRSRGHRSGRPKPSLPKGGEEVEPSTTTGLFSSHLPNG